MRTHIAALFVVLATGCMKDDPVRDGWAVGTYLGGGSWPFGPTDCTYRADPRVAEIRPDYTKMAKVIGEGPIVETCGSTRRTFDALRATRLEMNGPSKVTVGSTELAERFGVEPFAKDRRLGGVHVGGESPDWTLGPDCEGIATFAPVLGSSDTGGPDITRQLVTTKPGHCTVSVSILGLTVTRTVEIAPR